MMRHALPRAFLLLASLAPCCACVALDSAGGSSPVFVAALKFTVQPSSTPVSAAIAPAVAVQALDSIGHGVAAVAVNLSVGTNAADNGGSAVLGGTLTHVTDATGTASFSDLTLDWLGTGYTLVAAASGASRMISATSTPFDETRVGEACLGPAPACSSGCADSEGDGLNDAWEIAGGVDLNGDGKIDAQHDLLLPGADPHKPDIYVKYDWMDYGLSDAGCTADSQCPALGGAHLGERCIGPPAQSEANSCASGCTADADCTDGVHNACTTIADCAPGSYCDSTGTHQCQRGAWHAGERCVQNLCEHTHDPLVLDGDAFQPVVERFAAHGINLHILRGNAQPHSHVISYRKLSQFDANCEGASVAAGTAGLGKYAESLYDIKPRSSPDRLNIAYHYAFFGHYVGCDTADHCTPPSSGGTSDCPYSTNPDGTAKNTPAQGQSGLAEIYGNDLVVSLGGLINDQAFSPHYVEQATFMHELGHNLGLRHDGHMDTPCRSDSECRSGDTCVDLGDGEGLVCHQITGGMTGKEQPNYKPNYLSIMNYRYETNGIPIAAAAGSSTRTQCMDDVGCGGDGGMCEAGYCVRLDYSRQTLPTGGNTPGALVENNLNEPEGLGSGTPDLLTYKAVDNGFCKSSWTLAPSTGPVDWNGNGDPTETGVQADVDALSGTGCGNANPQDTLTGYTDWPDLSGIPFDYAFQCRSTGGPMGDGVAVAPLPAQPELSGTVHIRRKSMNRRLPAVATALLAFAAAFPSPAQEKPGAAGGAARPAAAAAKSDDPISREQADAILGELRAIHLLLERQELRPAAAQQPRLPAPSERVTLSMADAGRWYSQGKEDAPVTIVEFTDYQCPYCRRFDQNTFADLKKNYIETGKVRFLARDLPLEFHANAQRAAEAARCAGDQGKYWEMRQELFAVGGELSREAMVRDAQSLALNEPAFTSCLDSEKHKAEILADLAESTRLRISGTPTFVVGRSGKDALEGVRINGAQPLGVFDAAIRQVMGSAE